MECSGSICDAIISGIFYVCGSNEEGELVSLTDVEMERYSEMFWEPEEISQEEIEKATRFEVMFFDL